MTRRRHLSIRREWEDAIREGRKDIDARFVDDDVVPLKIGAVVRYPGARVRVTGMRFYAGMRDLLAREDWHRIDPDGSNAEHLRQLLEDGRGSAARHREAVAVEFEPVSSGR
jgi:ASC-1-like (ASCH) protein